MKAHILLVWFFVAPGHPYVLQPSVDVTVIQDWAEWSPERLREPRTGEEEDRSQEEEPGAQHAQGTGTQSEEDYGAGGEEEERAVLRGSDEEDQARGEEEERDNTQDESEDEEQRRYNVEVREEEEQKREEEQEVEPATPKPLLSLESTGHSPAEGGTESPHVNLTGINQHATQYATPPAAVAFAEAVSQPVTQQATPPTILSVTPSGTTPVTRPVSQTPGLATDTKEAAPLANAHSTNYHLAAARNATDGSQPRLREAEGVVPTAMAVGVRPTVRVSASTKRAQKSKPPKRKETGGRAKAKLPAKTKKGKKEKKEEAKEKDKKGKPLRKDRKAKKPKQEKEIEPTTAPYFPYFKDDYCPSDCACYGRVVQCSDKGLDKIPYGIPYNSRYILLMNNAIDGIQLDLLPEYLSMEFLVLSNNRLTDGTIEGAFEGVRSLRRLYLDRNLLRSVPADLPASLEELRLDGNGVSAMSEAAWARCPGLLVLSLSNNSLGLGSGSLPAGVLSPLGSLRTLSLDGNQLTAVPRRLPPSLRELYLRGNLVERFPDDAFAGAAELLVLDLSANRLGNEGLGKGALRAAGRLESLNLEGNLLRRVPRHLPASLKALNLEGNAIAAVGKAAFLALPRLEHLGLARNRIARVAAGAFRALPALHQLDLGYNALRQVPRRLPPSLRSAALAHNQIRAVPRDAFCWGAGRPPLSHLVRVQLEHNLLDLGRLDSHAFRCLRGFQVVHFY